MKKKLMALIQFRYEEDEEKYDLGMQWHPAFFYTA